MSRNNTGTGGISKSSGPKSEGNKPGPFPNTYYGNSDACDTDRYNKDGHSGGGETRRGK